jgi:flavin-dependent dehydrogenase
MSDDYDVVVVGGRCAGATLAALLAGAGVRTLVVDRVAFPSPTVSTHTMHADALAVLRDAGSLEVVRSLGAPAIREVVCDYGDFQIAGAPPPVGGIDYGLCVPRRELDAALLRHAAGRGAQVAERTPAIEPLTAGDRVAGVVLRGPGGERLQVRAGVVVGADGRLSTMAGGVGAAVRHRQRSRWYLWFGSFADVPPRDPPAYELYFESASFLYVFPTSDGLHVVGGEFAFDDHPPRSGGGAAGLEALVHGHRGLAERLGGGRLVDGPYGMFRIDSFMREPAGPGWALVGDASFFKDPCTGQGMYDAFRGAQLLAGRLVEAQRLADYGEDREREFGDWYRFTCRAAQAPPISRERRRLLRLVAASPELTREYLGIQNHSVKPTAFFNKSRLRALLDEEVIA